jgi:transketolase
MPNTLVLRPADANEVAWCWKAALDYDKGPSLIVLTRQNVPTFERTQENTAKNVTKGGYILADSENDQPDVILMGSGSEVYRAMEAKEKLADKNIDARVVSMPSWELFRQQDEAYREQVLPKDITARVSIEAAASQGWREWVGTEGAIIGVDRFGASAPYETIFQEYGITSDRMVEEALKLIG